MLRFKYIKYNSKHPSSELTSFGNFNVGKFPAKDNSGYYYGEINCDASKQSEVATAMANYSPVFLSDAQALAYADAVYPTNEVYRKARKWNAAAITNGSLEKGYTEIE